MRHHILAPALATCLLLSSSAYADHLIPTAIARHGQPVPYLLNTSRIAVFGNPSQSALHHALANTPFRLVSSSATRDVTVVSLEHAARKHLDKSDLLAISQLLVTSPGVSGVGPVYFDGPALQVSTGRIWIHLPRGTGRTLATSTLANIGLTLVDYIDAAHGIAIGVPAAPSSIEPFVSSLVSAGYDAVPELMRRYQHQSIPSDPYFERQWTLRNTGDNVKHAISGADITSIALADARVSDAWDISTGSPSTLVAVIDSGTDCSHPELASKCVQPYNAVSDIPDSSPPPIAQDMMAGHGTSVAGIVAAPIDNTGMVGVCPDCRIVPVRLIETATFLTDAMMLRAFKHAVDAGASVINNSWGPSVPGEYFIPVSTGELQGIQYAGQARGGLGTLVVYAAGNEDSDTQYLGHLATGEPNVIAVAASNHHDARSSYSNFGVFLDVAAPTNDSYNPPSVISLEIVGAGDLDDNYTASFGGTSAAAPVVSGVAALILSVDPSKSAAEVREILSQSADKVDADGGFWDANGFSVLYGYGRVNALRALLAAQGVPDPACESPAPAEECATHTDENCDGYVDEGCSTASNVGLLCSAVDECGPEPEWLCPDDGKVRGICTQSCNYDPCPSGAACIIGRCAPYCNDDHPCPQTDTVCTDDVLGVCLRRCSGDPDCPQDEICDPLLGYCVLDTDGLPGSPCVSDECVGPQAMCLGTGMGFPDGYCTHACVTDAQCEGGGKCFESSYGKFCYKACSFDGDCREHYVCEQAGPRAGSCYRKCDKDSQCRGTEPGWEHIICDLSTGRCVDSGQSDAGADASPDADSDANADAEAPVDAAGDVAADVAPDAESDATMDAAPPAPRPADDDGGCSCRTAQSQSSSAWVLLGLAALLLRRRAPASRAR